jgi:hypothetical protein
MATFVWPAEVQWPPPAHVLLNYDVVPPTDVGIEAQGVLHSAFVPPDTHGGIRYVNITPPAGQAALTAGDLAMTTGDKSAQSYGWGAKLAAAVPDGGDVTIPTPGFDEQYTDVRYAEVTVEGFSGVWRTDEGMVTITFVKTEPYSATVLNSSGQEWPAGRGIYIFCPHLLAEGHNEFDVKGQVWDLQKRVSALEDMVASDEQEEG